MRIGTKDVERQHSSVTEDSCFVCKVDILLMNLILEQIPASSRNKPSTTGLTQGLLKILSLQISLVSLGVDTLLKKSHCISLDRLENSDKIE